MPELKILWGVCGIGSGHTFRQLPLIERFLPKSRLVIFAYGEAYKFYCARYHGRPNVNVVNVAVPFYVSDRDGINFGLTARHPANAGVDFLGINTAAMARAQTLLGKPDLVISDYEPVSAQYASSQGAPLVTIDQQSKYLTGRFTQELVGQNCNGEVQLLRMFFPGAQARIACSFFNVGKERPAEPVLVVAPVIRPDILNMVRTPRERGNSIVVYLSSQQAISQSVSEVVGALNSQPQTEFHVFTSDSLNSRSARVGGNVHFHNHGDAAFYKALQRCSGVISTAGHTLLSECMHLGLPVYALPLPVYEQLTNALIIKSSGFGLSHPAISAEVLEVFLKSIPRYAAAIKADRKILLRGSGEARILRYLSRRFLGGIDLTG